MKICPSCGASVKDEGLFCPNCGERMAVEPTQTYAEKQAAPKYETSSTPVERPIEIGDLPDRYKPLNPWAYVGYALLYSIPIVGFIFLIVNSTGAARNLNKRNFARSYWAWLAVIATVAVIVMIVLAATGASIGALLSEL